MITELTPEQEKQMEATRDKWLEIGLATAPEGTDREEAEAAVRQAYTCAELAEPKWVFFFASPKRGALAVAVIKDLEEREKITEPPSQADLERRVDELMQVETLPQNIKKHAQDAIQWTCYGHHDAGWLAFYDFWASIGVEGLDALAGLNQTALHAGWWWPMDEIAVITDKPIALHRDEENRLHNETGQAIGYPDGWGLYVWHGVSVPPDIIENPAGITAERILSEANAEVRRVMIDRFGLTEFLEAANATLLHEDKDQYDLPRKLWQVEFTDGQDPWTALEVPNSTPEQDGTRKTYILPVPADITTVQAGLAWTFNMEAGEYNPDQET